MRTTIQSLIAAATVLTLGITPAGQGTPAPVDTVFGGPFSSMPVTGAAFTAEAITTVRKRIGDGSLIEVNSTSRYYRDRNGRVRVEHLTPGLQARGPSTHRQFWVQPTPGGPVYWTDPAERTFWDSGRWLAASVTGGDDSFAVRLDVRRWLIFTKGFSIDRTDGESLGSERIEGIETVGRRYIATPSAATYERWESPELKLLVRARHDDPHTGTVQYQLTHVRREDPAPHLFELPADFVHARASADGPQRYCLVFETSPHGVRPDDERCRPA